MAVIVDTNVLIVANRISHYSTACARACIQALLDAKNDKVVIDDAFRILNEYKKNVNEKGQPGLGDEFLLWLLQNRQNPIRCEQVAITQQSNDPNDFAEFPTDPALQKFDASDRKFVAVALTSRSQPEILNAVDSDWWLFREAFQQNGVSVRFLCPDAMPK